LAKEKQCDENTIWCAQRTITIDLPNGGICNSLAAPLVKRLIGLLISTKLSEFGNCPFAQVSATSHRPARAV
jgi:hypothetical protein